MITDLFVASSGIDAAVIAGAIPPACRRAPAAPASGRMLDGEWLLESAEWRPRVPARHLVPSVSVLTSVAYTVRFEISAWASGTWSPWIATATIGPGAFADLPSTGAVLACETDVYTAAKPLERVRLRVRLMAQDAERALALAGSPWMATLSACDLAPAPHETTTVPRPRLRVPALSQLEAPHEIARRICSPTSVAIVLGYWGVAASPLSVADDVFHAATDSYGIWPAATRAAGRRGVAGYLLRFPDWPAAAWCLQRGLPLVASVRYPAGALTGAPLAETSGHLLVLAGCDRTHVLVNDPIAPAADDVPRRYRLDEFQRAWLEGSGIGYVLFRPDQR